MTENEIREEIKELKRKVNIFENSGYATVGISLSFKKAVKVIEFLLEEIQQYRAIGTVEGYERAIQSSVENYNLYREYKAKVQEYEAIGTIEEFKALKEKSVAKKPLNDGMRIPFSYYCPNCKEELSDDGYEPDEEYCCNCGQHILIEN